MEAWKQDDRNTLMSIGSAAPLDKYHTVCHKCNGTFAYLHCYKVDDHWYCGKCYRDMEQPTTGKRNRRGVMVDERST